MNSPQEAVTFEQALDALDWTTLGREEMVAFILGAVDRARVTAWDEGYEAAARFHEGREKGHWESDRPRKGMRTWVADLAPVNPHRNA